ncbi:NAD(P)H-dependent glycerol-3-phosphate dehydrogenase [Campylobacter sp. US33a]|uniref:Glycerol-3-phosphate dehydrogenase [NAD(P)+] n=1 Tax=Campylobacter sp. CCS1377 TaxID=3158229 RepID=A0AAU7E704_9BACT|nr:NAD(P)H-dependent glycerol-3-phosphate dehydrogenase [Campylobacter sp. US33a]MCW1360643.1 NAD(P)H-dependent glycerol-3-phosphate dehydrogenase [Campylobacter jejuni]TEY03422.1 NAD(P)H-dependent glycerol-3-phosphate dehydrogenase [Campylobacter sp. US33a]
MSKIAVIGAGKWGSALHSALSIKNTCVITSRTQRALVDFVSLQQALDCEYLIFALSSQGIHSWLEQNFINKGQKILIASKGIETSTCKFLDEIFSEFVDKDKLCVLSGPSFAAEVMQKLPCALMISGVNQILCKEFANFFPDFIKAYTNDDVRGAEICGAYKNVLAIASGISDGLKLGNNARASLISRGLVEMHRFGKFFGAKEETFLGLSGAGDLFLTATSTLSRNYRAGLMLALGKGYQDIINELKEVVEGIPTAFAIEKISQKEQIYTPIVKEVVAILYGKDAKESLKDLLRQN